MPKLLGKTSPHIHDIWYKVQVCSAAMPLELLFLVGVPALM